MSSNKFAAQLTSKDGNFNLRRTNLIAAIFHTLLLAFVVGMILYKGNIENYTRYVCTDDFPTLETNTLSCDCSSTTRHFFDILNVQLLRLTTRLPSFMSSRLEKSIVDTTLNPNECTIPPKCTFWGEVSTDNFLPPINLAVLTVAFTVITIVAHVVYFARYARYLEMIKSGYNMWRWVEYGLSASVMAVLLAVLSGVRLQTSIWMVFVATFVQMLQGYLIEHSISINAVRSPQCYVPLAVGWLLLIVVWVTIGEAWFSGVNSATNDIKKCIQDNTCGNAVSNEVSDMPSDSLAYLIIITIVLFSSFGVVNLVYFINAYRNGPLIAKKSFPVYEFTYICLSFLAKALLILWAFFSLFSGELRWLQTGGVSSQVGPTEFIAFADNICPTN